MKFWALLGQVPACPDKAAHKKLWDDVVMPHWFAGDIPSEAEMERMMFERGVVVLEHALVHEDALVPAAEPCG